MSRLTVTSNDKVVVVVEEYTVEQIATEIAKRNYFEMKLKQIIKLKPDFLHDAALYMIHVLGIRTMWGVVFDYDNPTDLDFTKLTKEGFDEFRKGMFKEIAQEWARYAQRNGCAIYNRHGENSYQNFQKTIEKLWEENSIKTARQLFEESKENTENGTHRDSFELEEHIKITW